MVQSNRDEVLHRVLREQIVAIIRLRGAADLVAVAEALLAGGITLFEFTATTPGAMEAIVQCRARFGDNALIGMGTVLDAATARQATTAGAQFLISPVWQREVIEAAHASSALAIPGALVPQDIVAATEAGADIVKVFPARVFGPQYIADLLAPLPHLRLMPTGGVSAENVPAYLRAGAVAVALGGSLVDEALVAARDWRALTRRARAVVEAVHPPQ
ncbi:MAG TPA: bifunctional 4-hydroxy-2-oxoglutarate aldolase/2-dehydro-3-deoxy-phosphogluconate aldolase [Ktedonobacterales bacterium]